MFSVTGQFQCSVIDRGLVLFLSLHLKMLLLWKRFSEPVLNLRIECSSKFTLFLIQARQDRLTWTKPCGFNNVAFEETLINYNLAELYAH